MIRIAFYKSQYGDMLDKFISLVTNSPYSHCEIVFSNGLCVSSSMRDKGIRFKYIKSIGTTNHWDIFELKNLNVTENEIKAYFLKHCDEPYDYLGAIGSALKKDWNNVNKKFCSLAIAQSLNIYPSHLSPGDLYKWLIKNKKI